MNNNTKQQDVQTLIVDFYNRYGRGINLLRCTGLSVKSCAQEGDLEAERLFEEVFQCGRAIFEIMKTPDLATKGMLREGFTLCVHNFSKERLDTLLVRSYRFISDNLDHAPVFSRPEIRTDLNYMESYFRWQGIEPDSYEVDSCTTHKPVTFSVEGTPLALENF